MNIENEIKINETPSENELRFVFTPISDSSHYTNIFTKENFKTLEKWGLIQNMELVKFRFNINLDLKDLDRFLKDLFNDVNVKKNFPPLGFISINDESRNKIENFKFNKLGTKSTNMDLFNVLYETGLCSEKGYIQKDFEDYYEEIHVSDKLKQALLLEDSEFYSAFNEDMRNEFLFHIFKRIAIGGSLCQYEDYVDEYLALTKLFYKDLTSATRDANTKEIFIRSIALEILNVENSNLYRIPEHPQNFFYVIIDPYQRHVHLWYHKWAPFW